MKYVNRVTKKNALIMQAIKTKLTSHETKRSATSSGNQALGHSKFPYSNPTKGELQTKVSKVDRSRSYIANYKCLNKQTAS